MIGVATSRNCERAAGEMGITLMRGEKVGFVCRYTNHNSPSKNLTPGEILALHDAGLKIVNVWENGYPNKPEYGWSREKGQYDAGLAVAMAAELGQPPATPIYYAIDWDAYTTDQKAEVLSYLYGLADASADSDYQVGVYGGVYTLDWASKAGLAQYFWQAFAPGWSGHTNGETWKGAHLRGLGPRFTCAGVDVDLMEALAEDYGGW